MTFAREDLSSVMDDVMPLVQRHWDELGEWTGMPFSDTLDRYLETDRVRFYTVRRDGKIVGYSLFVLAEDEHVGVLAATEAALYLLPEYRGRTIGYRFLAWTEEQLDSEGAQIIYRHTTPTVPLGPLLEKLGHQVVDVCYARRVR